MPVALGPPSLVGVSCTRVLEATEHLGFSLIGRVPDGDAVFVVGNADIAAIVAAVSTVKSHTLSIMCIAVCTGTTRLVWVGRVIEVDIFQTSRACLVARLSTDSDSVLIVPVDDDLPRVNHCLPWFTSL